MSNMRGIITGSVGTLLLCGASAGAWWMLTTPRHESKSEKPVPPASVAKTIKETDLLTVELKPEAEKRLDLQVGKIERTSLPRERVYGGEVMVATGRTVLVAAPLSGVLSAVQGEGPHPGEMVKRGQPILVLRPLLTPDSQATLSAARVDADGQVKNALAQVEAMKIARDRARRLLRDEAGSRRQVDEAEAQHELAVKTWEAVTARLELLTRVLGEVDRGTSAPLSIDSPRDGLLRNVNAFPDQTVPAGAALFEVVSLDRVWVRVPIPVGDLSDVDSVADAQVGRLTSRPGETPRVARPVVAPPSANALAATVDRYFETLNRDARWVPGERVAVTLRLAGDEQSLTVPWSAVVQDINGGTWIYERTRPLVFERRRVLVRRVVHETAELSSGPPEGTTVVVAGAQELFGAESGFKK
ncbi:MAG: HlyD family efflux transporter periplasmic adaptor subunit [Planctomycetaceae bacterium]|nr:HlyD family efflux transporter periplasmic adaptor subunit [Planctomycetaceae bacterium]